VKYQTNSLEETQKIASDLAKKMKPGVIALYGDLGAGKTTFTQGFAKGLGIKDKIISPTFVLIRQHQIPNKKQVFYHVDMYRIDNPASIKELGIEDLLNTKDDLVLIEWAEKIEDFLPKNSTKIFIKTTSENQRQITIS